MMRREFITLLGSAAVAWPAVAQAQEKGKLPTIGFFGNTSASGGGPWTAAFVQRLGELGWINGRTATSIAGRRGGAKPMPKRLPSLSGSRLTSSFRPESQRLR